MADEYTPTTEFVRGAYRFDRAEIGGVEDQVADAEFGRWLAARDRLPEVPDDAVIEAMAKALWVAEFPWVDAVAVKVSDLEGGDKYLAQARAAYAALRGAMQ